MSVLHAYTIHFWATIMFRVLDWNTRKEKKDEIKLSMVVSLGIKANENGVQYSASFCVRLQL